MQLTKRIGGDIESAESYSTRGQEEVTAPIARKRRDENNVATLRLHALRIAILIGFASVTSASDILSHVLPVYLEAILRKNRFFENRFCEITRVHRDHRGYSRSIRDLRGRLQDLRFDLPTCEG
jgi:hypothetical protein